MASRVGKGCCLQLGAPRRGDRACLFSRSAKSAASLVAPWRRLLRIVESLANEQLTELAELREGWEDALAETVGIITIGNNAANRKSQSDGAS